MTDGEQYHEFMKEVLRVMAKNIERDMLELPQPDQQEEECTCHACMQAKEEERRMWAAVGIDVFGVEVKDG